MTIAPIPARAATVPLSKQTRVLLLILTLCGFAGALSNIFVNVYLYKMSEQLYRVFLFHLCSYLIWVPVYIGAGWLCKRIDRRRVLTAGLLFFVLFYAVVLLAGSALGSRIYLTGLLYGIGASLYWFSVNLLMVDYTTKETRDWFNGVSGVVTSASQMIGPLAAGLIITAGTGFAGYRVVFGLSFVLFLAGAACTQLLPPRIDRGRLDWSRVRGAGKLPEWRKLTVCFTALHFRDDVLSFFLWIYMFTALQNEGAMGNYSFLLTALSTAAYYAAGRFGRKGNRKAFLLAGGIVSSMALLLWLFDMNGWLLLSYTVLAGAAGPFFQVAFSTIYINSISAHDESGKYKIELLIARELAISAGRIASVAGLTALCLLLPVTKTLLGGYMVLLVAAGLVPVYVYCFPRRKTVQQG